MTFKATSLLRQSAETIRHFTSARAVEVLALQASPLLGALIGSVDRGGIDVARLVFLLIGSVALTAHVFVLNDWSGRSSDLNDPLRATRVFGQRGICSRQVAAFAVFLLFVATGALALVGLRAMLFVPAIAGLSVLYSCSPFFGKGRTVLASLIHLVGGALIFLLGYITSSPIDGRGIAISMFFGFVFAGGHLNQEVRDYNGDLRNAIRTNAVVFGCRQTFLASLITFTAAYAVFGGLALVQILPRPLLCCLLLWPWHVAWSLKTLSSNLGFDAACWMQRRYRLLFAVIGLSMLVTTVAPTFSAGRMDFSVTQSHLFSHSTRPVGRKLDSANVWGSSLGMSVRSRGR